MRTRHGWCPAVNLISLSRLVAGLLFTLLAFQRVPLAFLAFLYGLAIGTDLIDGYLARRLDAETHFGKVLDLVSDKSLTIVSLLYAAARGIAIFPLAVIAAREIVMIGARLITIQGTQLLPSSKFMGGTMTTLTWGNTLFLLLGRNIPWTQAIAQRVYWAGSLIAVLNLAHRLYVSTHRIKVSLEER
jgi:CDP-diacylglycerol--glycerol-3-phosphate 3-phosphatidyltransferase